MALIVEMFKNCAKWKTIPSCITFYSELLLSADWFISEFSRNKAR